jgi:hypothetical protein
METSQSIKNIAEALFLFDSEMAKISKSATNPFFKNKYAPLPEILDAIKDPLAKSGLTVKQFPEGEHSMTTLILHPSSGEWISSNYVMRPTKDDPQGEGSRITYQRRYALGACLGLNIDEDDDGNKASEPKKPNDDLPWLSDKLYNQVLERIRSLDSGEFPTLDAFVENVFRTYKMKKEFRTGIIDELGSDFNKKMV